MPLSHPQPPHLAAARLALVALAASISLASAPAALAGELDELIDLTDEGVELELSIAGGPFASAATTSGKLTVIEVSFNAGRLGRVYDLDPSLGTARKTATVDPSVVEPNADNMLPIAGSNGEVYFIIGSNANTEQDVYRLETASLVHVADLTAQGVSIPLDPASGFLTAGVTTAGDIVVVYRDLLISETIRVVRIDPAMGTAAVESTLATPGASFGALAILDPADEVYLLLHVNDMMTASSRPLLFRVDGDSLIEVADLLAAGFRVPQAIGSDQLAGTVGSDGLVRVASRGFNVVSVLRIDPRSGETLLVSTVDASGVGGMTRTRSVFAFSGEPLFLIAQEDIVPQQSLFRDSGTRGLARVLDIGALGTPIELGFQGSTVTTVSNDGVVRLSTQHPTDPSLRRLHSLDPETGSVPPAVTVDLTDAFDTPNWAAAAFDSDGDAFYFIEGQNDIPTLPPVTLQQGLYRLDGGALTELVDIDANGVALVPTMSGGFPTYIPAAGAIQVLNRHPSVFDFQRVLEFDPGTGDASVVANLDVSAAGGSAGSSSGVFGRDGTLYLVVSDMAFPPNQTVQRRDGGALTEVVDLSAQGVELSTFSGSLALGTTDAGEILVADKIMQTLETLRLHSIDPVAGTASLEALVDPNVLSPSSAGMTQMLAAFDANGDVYLIASDSASMGNGQQMYLLSTAVPEPSAALLQAASIGVLALAARRGRASRRPSPRRGVSSR